ncbi:MAG: ATP synthase F1 subunit delta [Defluviitaleaceae bacterium]|nr:ATP synthase F1 subunit delta [Defluviitaleaceae bacterium]
MADLGKRYATALFELSAQQGLLARYLEQATMLRDALQADECKSFITHPRISGTDKKAFFDEAFKGKIHDHLMGFLHLTVNKNREDFLLPALNALVKMIRTHHNETTARVVSAVPLSKKQLTEMAALLTRKLHKKVDIHVVVDPAVIGGLSIQVDGFFIDRTLRYQLRSMKEEISK